MARRTNHRTNGHGSGYAGPKDRANGSCHHKAANGHGPASTEQGGISAHGDRAASDDARGTFVAGNANSSAADTNRAPYADAAPPSAPKRGRKRGKKEPKPEKEKKPGAKPKIVPTPGPTDFAAMQDSQAYANAVAAQVNLVALNSRLLQSGDEKIAKASLDRILEMKFGKIGASVTAIDEPVGVDLTGIPRPLR